MGSSCCVANFPCCVGDFGETCLWDTCTSCFLDSGSGCCVGNSSAPSESERHASEVANELAEMKEKAGNDAKLMETNILKEVHGSMLAYMHELEEFNNLKFGGETLSINMKAIREKNESLEKQITGCIAGVMNTRLVQTDKELSTILSERDSKKRKENFGQFVDRLRKEALKTFKESIKKTMNEQSQIVSKEVEVRKREVDARMRETIQELMEISDAKGKESGALEKKQIEYMYQSGICDMILREVEHR